MADEINLWVVAGDPLVRASIVSVLDELPGFLVLGNSSPVDALPLINDAFDEHDIHVLIWDLGWELDRKGLPLTQELDLPVMIMIEDPTQAPLAWIAGARGILPRVMNREKLRAAIRAAAQGLVVIDPIFSDALLPSETLFISSEAEALTARELEVLQLLAEGLTNKAVAGRLAISEHTVKFHVNSIMGKLNAQSRTEAVVRATQLGLIAL